MPPMRRSMCSDGLTEDVSAAAAYTIQIADSSAFAAPLVRDQTVTMSTILAGDLPVKPYFWRVRAINVAGVAGAWSAVRTFTPQPAAPPTTLSTFSTNPSTVVGGDPSSGTVVLASPAPDGGALIALTSSDAAVASVPATVTAPSFSFTATFSITTFPVAANTTITITAAYNGTTRTATLTVTPSPPAIPLPTIQSLVLNPATVTSGSNSQGTVTLTGGAPQGGALVTLVNLNPVAAGVPASVTVTAGATNAAFTITTNAVTVTTSLSILATYNSSNQSTVLTVNLAAVPPPPPPPQTATLSVTATGRSGERVSSNPAGISVAVGSSGSASFATGTAITLSVSNGRDAIWSGACSSGGNKAKTCTLTLTTTVSVTANVQ